MRGGRKPLQICAQWTTQEQGLLTGSELPTEGTQAQTHAHASQCGQQHIACKRVLYPSSASGRTVACEQQLWVLWRPAQVRHSTVLCQILREELELQQGGNV